jgi:SAM-dependent methyltransferase
MKELVKNNNKIVRFRGGVSLRDTTYTVRSQFIKFLLGSEFLNLSTILDFGSGNSPYKRYFSFDKYDTADVGYNIESKPDYVIDPQMPHIPVSDGSYDLVLALDVLEHVTKLQLTLKEIIRVCKPGGYVVVKVPFLYREHEAPHDFRRFTSYGIKMCLENSGLNVVKVQGFGNAWSVAYSLIQERFNDNASPNFYWRVINKLLSTILLPILNLTLFKQAYTKGIYGSILAVASKPVDAIVC